MTPKELEYHKCILRHLKGLAIAYEALVRHYELPFTDHAEASSVPQQRKHLNVDQHRSRTGRQLQEVSPVLSKETA